MGNSTVSSRNEGEVESTGNKRTETGNRQKGLHLRSGQTRSQFLEKCTHFFKVSTNAANQQGCYPVETETATAVTTNHLLSSLQSKQTCVFREKMIKAI